MMLVDSHNIDQSIADFLINYFAVAYDISVPISAHLVEFIDLESTNFKWFSPYFKNKLDVDRVTFVDRAILHILFTRMINARDSMQISTQTSTDSMQTSTDSMQTSTDSMQTSTQTSTDSMQTSTDSVRSASN